MKRSNKSNPLRSNWDDYELVCVKAYLDVLDPPKSFPMNDMELSFFSQLVHREDELLGEWEEP